MRLFFTSNVAFARSDLAFARSLVGFLVFIFFSFLLVPASFAATTPFRSANIVTTDGLPSYTNLNNCSATDGQTCDRTMALSYANLYFRDFGNYSDFGIPQGSTITKVKIRATGKTNAPLGIGLSSGITYIAPCQSPVDLWIVGGLIGQTINTQTFVANVVQESNVYGTVLAYCLHPANFENKNFIFKIGGSFGYAWSANTVCPRKYPTLYLLSGGFIPSPICGL